jgi:hypothetical protein
MPPVTSCSLQDQDPVLLQLLQLAAEAILAHPEVVPPALYDGCSSWADTLAAALNRPEPPGPDARRPEPSDLANTGVYASAGLKKD